MSLDTARRIARLLKATAPADFGSEERAMWWESKADSYDELGTDEPVYAAQMAELAFDARDRAMRLRRGGDSRAR
jgi:hypothetical protein